MIGWRGVGVDETLMDSDNSRRDGVDRPAGAGRAEEFDAQRCPVARQVKASRVT
jgi:hypothetical protein